MSEHTGASYQAIAAAYARKVDASPMNIFYERPALCSLLPSLAGLRVLGQIGGDGSLGPLGYCRENPVYATFLSRRRLNEPGGEEMAVKLVAPTAWTSPIANATAAARAR